jgi:hypothetical protein
MPSMQKIFLPFVAAIPHLLGRLCVMAKSVCVALIAAASFSICANAIGADTLYYSITGRDLPTGVSNSRTIDFSGFTNTIRQDWNVIHFDLHSVSDGFVLDFAGPSSNGKNPPAVGTYLNAGPFPFEIHAPALLFNGSIGIGPLGLPMTGQFEVLQASYDQQGNVLNFAADFLENLNGDPTTPVQGSIRYHSDIPLTVPEPSTLALLMLGAVGLLAVRRC